MVADGELTLVDEMIASRAYANPFWLWYRPQTDTTPVGNPSKKKLLQASGNTSNGTPTLGPLSCQA